MGYSGTGPGRMEQLLAPACANDDRPDNMYEGTAEDHVARTGLIRYGLDAKIVRIFVRTA